MRNNELIYIVEYAATLVSQLKKRWENRAVKQLDWDLMAELAYWRFRPHVCDQAARCFGRSTDTECLEKLQHHLDDFCTLTEDIIKNADADADKDAMEKIRRAKAQCRERSEWLAEKIPEAKEYQQRMNSLVEVLSRT